MCSWEISVFLLSHWPRNSQGKYKTFPNDSSHGSLWQGQSRTPNFIWTAIGIDASIRQCHRKCRPMLVLRRQKNAIVKVFAYGVFLFRFYSVVPNSWKIYFSLQLAQPFFVLSTSVVHSLHVPTVYTILYSKFVSVIDILFLT